MVRKTPVDVIVLDITMPGRDGLESLKDLKRDYPLLSVIILSILDDGIIVNYGKFGSLLAEVKQVAATTE